MEKVLLYFNESEYNHQASKLRSAAMYCQRLVEKISSINGFKLTNAGLTHILQGQPDLVAAGIKKAVEDDLTRARIASESIRDAAVKGDLEKYYAIVNNFQRPENRFWPHLSVDDEGKVTVSEKAFANLKEEYCLYVKTEKGLALRDAHKVLVEAMNNYIGLCSERFKDDKALKNVPFNFDTRQFDLIPINFDLLANDIMQ